MMALADRVSMRVDRADFDDLVTLVTSADVGQGPPRRDPHAPARDRRRERGNARRANPGAMDVAARARARKVLDRKASQEYPEAKRLLGALANSRGHRHEENAAKLVNTALELPKPVGAALLASAEAYTPRATKLLDAARERLGAIDEVALALAENLPQPKTQPSRKRRRRRRKKKPAEAQQQQQQRAQPKQEQPQPGRTVCAGPRRARGLTSRGGPFGRAVVLLALA